MHNLEPDHIILPKLHPSMYLMHKYWARKPHNIVASYIKKYSKESEIVLDPFCGSGVTIAESLILGRKTVGIDINPFSIFLTKNTITHVNVDLLKLAFAYLQKRIEKYPNFYEISCPHCYEKAEISQLIWRTDNEIVGFNNEVLNEIRISCKKCNIKNLIVEKEEFSSFYEDELKRIKQIRDNFSEIQIKFSLIIPDICFRYNNGNSFRQLRHKLIENPDQKELFSLRNLLILAIIKKEIENLHYGEIIETFRGKDKKPNDENDSDNLKQTLLLTFTANLGQSSKMVWVISRRKNKILKKKETGSWTHHFLWNPSEFFEIDPWRGYKTRIQKTIKGKSNLNDRFDGKTLYASDFNQLTKKKENKNILLLNKSSKIIPIPDNSIDYIFADPPYGDSIQYLELTKIWNGWLNLNLEAHEKEEITINSKQNKSMTEYKNGLQKIFSECYRVLKPEKYMTVTFHNVNVKIRNILISAVIESKFNLESLLFQMPPRKSLKSYLHYKNSPVGDYYIGFSKRSNITKDNSRFKLSKSDLNAKIKEYILHIIFERAEPTFGSLIYNFVDEYLVKLGYITNTNPSTISEVIKEMKIDGLLSISNNNMWWYGENLNPVMKHKPLSKRIEIYIYNSEDFLKRDKIALKKSRNSIKTYSEFYNLIYKNFNGILTPDRKQISKIFDKILKRIKN